MEHYYKINEECVEPINGSNNQRETELNQVISVTGDSKFYQVVRNACKCLKHNTQIVLVGEGAVSQKVVSIAEKVKETCSFNVSERIDIYDTDYKDLWVPKIDNMGLGNLEVTRAVPTTKILLKQEVDEPSESERTVNGIKNHQKKPGHHDSLNGKKHPGGGKNRPRIQNNENGSFSKTPRKTNANKGKIQSSANGSASRKTRTCSNNVSENNVKKNNNAGERNEHSERPSIQTDAKSNNDKLNENFNKQNPSEKPKSSEANNRKPQSTTRNHKFIQTGINRDIK